MSKTRHKPANDGVATSAHDQSVVLIGSVMGVLQLGGGEAKERVVDYCKPQWGSTPPEYVRRSLSGLQVYPESWQPRGPALIPVGSL